MEMEKASLIVQKTKKGKIVAKVKILDSGKIVPIQNFPDVTLEMNDMEVDLLREKGQPVLIRNGENILLDSRSLSKAQKPSPFLRKKEKLTLYPQDEKLETEHIEYVQTPAYAPYNFVPLNKTVIQVEVVSDDADKKKRPFGLTFDAYHDAYHTGWIELEIETITPIFIRGKEKEPNFYSPSGKPSIPGSSLRGMIRQMVEIVSFGKFGFFDDKKTLYYRGLADRSNLRNDYQSKMSSYDRNRRISAYSVSAGIIKKEGLKYYIIPTSFDRIPKGKAGKMVADLGENYKEFEFYELKEHYLVVSGNMKNKKHDWLIKKAESKMEIIPIENEEDIQNYINDKTRKVLKDKNDEDIPSILNIIELLDKGIKNQVPCFYVLWKDIAGKNRVSFGHTAMFRLSYEKPIGDHVPEDLIDMDICDIAGAMFGNETDFAGRVFFEDAMVEEGNNDIFSDEKYMKILSGPKPTTFQHYLVQTEEHIKNRKHYNSNSSIRGNKIYWHKSGNDWEETNEENINKHPKQYSKINPVHTGVKFHGRIRFENLSDIELGALFFSLELPEGCCHKIGMGKPLGLGSIKICPKLYLSKRKKRYQDLLAEWNNDIAEYENKSYFTDIFEMYVLHAIGEKQTASLWNTVRLKELLLMLHYDIGKKMDKEIKTHYMDLQSFRNRSILPKPSQVAGEKSFKNLNKMIKMGELNTVSDKKKGDDKLSTDDTTDQLPNYIKEIEIDSLWDRYRIKWELNNDVNILIGVNGSGKSTVLRLIKHVLINQPFERDNYSIIPDMIRISYDKGKSSIYKSRYRLSEFKLEMLDKAITLKRIDEDDEKINLLKDWAKIDKIFEGKNVFLAEVNKVCGTEWVEKRKHELLSECYDDRNDLKLKDMSEYVTNELIVTFDRFLPQEEIDKIKGNQSILDHDLEGTHNDFITESERLNIDKESDNIKTLLSIVNTLFEDTGKNAFFAKSEGLTFTKNGKSIIIPDLSSGEKQLVYILLKVFLGSIKNKPMILLLDEPEISLHPGWQLGFINHIRELHKNMQIIIASHSPAITFENWFNHETQMKSIMELKYGNR